MKKLIINADDFGLTKGCSDGIIKAMRDGILTNTTIMINMPFAKEAIELAKENGINELGLHLTLTCGSPISRVEKVVSLLDEEGKFFRRKEPLFSQMKLEEVRLELENQIKTFMKSGLKLTHLDSHHHIHMYDGVRKIAVELAKEYKLPLRHPNIETKKYILENGIRTTDNFSMEFYGEKVGVEGLKKIIEEAPEGITEIMAHPAYLDEKLMKISNYNSYREKELEVLTSIELKKWLEDKSIELTSFQELRD